MRTIVFSWVSFLGLLCACPVFGQAAKALLPTQEEYDKWATLSNEGISATGSWVCYKLDYPRGTDSLFVKNAASGKRFTLVGHETGHFAGDSHFYSLSPSGTFVMYDLEDAIKWEVSNIARYEILSDGKHLLLYTQAANGKFSIEFRRLDGVLKKRIDDVTSVTANPFKSAIAVCRNELDKVLLELISVRDLAICEAVARKNTGMFANLKWQPDGKAITCVYKATEEASPESLLIYNLNLKKTYILATEKLAPFGQKIDAYYVDNLAISNDGRYVLFTAVDDNPEPANMKEIPSIWNAYDTELESRRSRSKANRKYWFSWQPITNKLTALDSNFTTIEIATGNKYALAYNDRKYKPSFRTNNYNDIHVIDFDTGKSRLLVTNQSDGMNRFVPSQTGSFIAYFNDGCGYITDVAKGTVIRLNDFKEFSAVNGDLHFVAWEQDERAALFSDGHAIWRIHPSGGQIKKLTPNQAEIDFRLVTNDRIVSFERPILLHASTPDHHKSGYFSTDGYGKSEQLIFAENKYSELKYSDEGESFSFLEEDFSTPASLILSRGNTTNNVVRSNPQVTGYKWSKSELIEYDGNLGKLNGVLCYPFNYDPDQTYPMIVLIYERQNFRLHDFVNPSLLNPAAFNVTYYTSRGYFVLFPDIDYIIGEPGFSATRCVVNATEATLAKVPVNSDKIGLMGHSFGGYETNFIITQTDIFTAAISGAGVSDLASCYLTENAGGHNTNFWRFEEDQMRMGKSFFDNPQAYFDNSPITHAAKIKIPLLLIVGQKDFQVGVSQSMEFHLALRRLQKENVLLTYPNEGHVFGNAPSQTDATAKAGEWFDYYLKNGSRPTWSLSR